MIVVLVVLLISLSVFIILKDNPFFNKLPMTSMAVADSKELTREEAKEAVVGLVHELVACDENVSVSHLLPS